MEINKSNQHRVIKKFTFLPLRIYQYTSQRTWWSWLSTVYVFQSWHFASEGFCSDSPVKWVKSYFLGGYWKNERMSCGEEYGKYKTK